MHCWPAETERVQDAVEAGNDMDVSGINFDDDFGEQHTDSKSDEKDRRTILKEYVVCVCAWLCVCVCACVCVCPRMHE